MTWTKYDPTDKTTWPPTSGADVLVAYRVPAGFSCLCVTWANRDSSYEYPDVEGVGAEWCDSDVSVSDDVLWRPITAADFPPSAIAHPERVSLAD